MAKVKVEVPRRYESTLRMWAVRARIQQSGGQACAEIYDRNLAQLAGKLDQNTTVYIGGAKHHVVNNKFVPATS